MRRLASAKDKGIKTLAWRIEMALARASWQSS